MKVLYAEDEESIREYLSLVLEGELDLKVVPACNGEEAVEILKNDLNREIGWVISDYNMPKKNGGYIYHYVAKERPETPFIFITTQLPQELKEEYAINEERPLTFFLSKPFEVQDVLDTIQKCGKFQSMKADNGYAKVNIFRFLRFFKGNCDIYLKLSPSKYVKIMGKKDLYDHETILKYVDKKCEFFYIPRSDYAEFLDDFSRTIFKKFDENGNLEEGEKINTQLAAIHLVQEKLVQLGLDKSVFTLVDKTTQSCLNSLKKNPSLVGWLEKIIKGNNYIYEHSLLCSYLSVAMVTHLSWSNKEIFEKLCMASILHDIGLESPELARFETSPHPPFPHVSYKQWEKFKRHPTEALTLLKNCRNIPADVEQIIAQHHENIEGTGWPAGLPASKINPLTALFIVAEDFATRIFNQELTEENFQQSLIDMERKYSTGNFKKSFEALVMALPEGANLLQMDKVKVGKALPPGKNSGGK